LAAWLRQATAGIAWDVMADRVAELREGREAEQRHQAQEAERDRELTCQLEIER
jgi:hypothetical protein